MKNKVWALGDLHGNYDSLMSLYKQLPINPNKDILVVLGDFIDGGSQAKQVVQQLMRWKRRYPHWQILKGNHEDLMLDALLYKGRRYHSFDLWYQQGGRATFLSYLPKGLTDLEKALVQPEEVIPKSHLLWIASLPYFYQDDKYIYVHGGLKPGKTIEETPFMDAIWIRDEFIDSDWDWKKKVIYGHTPHFDLDPKKNLRPYVQKNKIGIDTCHFGKGRLTAIELPAEKFYFQETF